MINSEFACDDWLVFTSCYVAQIAARASVKKCLFLFWLLRVFLAISYGFDILKRCDEAFVVILAWQG